MKNVFFLISFLSFSAIADECQVELFTKVYRLETAQALQVRDIVKASSCMPEISNKIAHLVSNSEGSVGSDFLKRELQREFPEIKIDFINKKLSLLDFNSTLRDQIIPGSNLYFTQSRSLNGVSSVGLSDGEQLKAICDSCQSFGEKTVKIDISNVVENSSRTLWFASKIMAKVKVVKAKRSITFQQKNLDVNDFYLDEVMTMMPDNALTSLDNIHFFKTNRTILQGAVVSNTDIQAVNLVTYGTPISLTLKSSSINLQKTVMPMRSARFGESIEIKGPNNKIIVGKVVDYNKAVIEL
jgi:flagella basal body P-ring formation protein FlgA